MEEDFKEFEAKSVDEAIVQAMKTFRLDFESLEIQVVSEGSKGIFGIGTKSARILARPAAKGETRPVRPAPHEDEPAPRDREEHRDHRPAREHYEHRERNYEMALEMTRAALALGETDALRHRETRLAARIAKPRTRPLL